MSIEPIFHICQRADWEAAERQGFYEGTPQDRADGFIHFSDRSQVVASAARYHAGRKDLVLITVDAAELGNDLVWERSRSGRLFPHLHGVLPLTAVLRVDDLPLGPDGRHVFPPVLSQSGGG